MMIHYRPYFSLLLLAVCAGILSACSHTPTTPPTTFGEVDRTIIAADTIMQADMDFSYEYQKTLVQSDSVVYDFLAFDRPKRTNAKEWEGKFILIRRTRTNQDTVVRDARFGPVRGLTIADLDQDGRPEILFYEDQPVGKNRWRLRVYSQKPDGTFKGIYWRQLDAKTATDHYRGSDTFFVYQNRLIRRYPYYDPDTTSAATHTSMWQSYKLSHDQLVLENEKIQR
jgi:hypothetical protein